MGISSVQITRVAGNLSINAPAPSQALVVGPSSIGTTLNTYSFAQPTDIATNVGYGPGPTAASIILRDNGGTVLFIKSAASVAGYLGPVTTSSVPTVTVSGTPYDTYQFVGSITQAGTTGSAIATTGVGQFTYSLDNGQTTSTNLPLTGTFVVPNTGLTLSFGQGNFAVGNSFTFNAYAPQLQAADLTNALNTLTGSSVTPTLILVANDSQSAVSGSTLLPALDGALTTLGGPNGANIFTVGILPAGGVNGQASTSAGAFSSVAASTGNIIEVIAERANCVVPLGFTGYGNPQLPFAYAIASRLQGTPLSTNPASFQLGPLGLWTKPTYDEFVQGVVYQNALIGAPRTAQGYPGTFLNQGLLKSSAGSAYQYIQWGRVIMLASQILSVGLTRYLNSAVRVKLDGTGQIDPRDANRIEQDINGQLNAGIMQQITSEGFKGWASSVVFTVNRTNNVLTTSTVQGSCALVPLANVGQVTVQLGFSVAVTPAGT